MKNKGNRTHSRAKDHRTCLPCPLIDYNIMLLEWARAYLLGDLVLSAVQDALCNTEGSRWLITNLFHLNSCPSG